jgi:2,3-bisphosphoglycerate-dependent phosphoglycerate mutase
MPADPATVDILLVRHALPVWPEPGGPDEYHRSLTDEGHAAAEALVDELLPLAPTAIVSSPYLRAIQTVTPLAGALGLPVATQHDLREWDSGLGPTPDYGRHHAHSWAEPDIARPGGESLAQLTARATAALNLLAERHRTGTVVVGSHGTFIARALVGFGATHVGWPFARTMPMPGSYRFRFDATGVRLTGPGL